MLRPFLIAPLRRGFLILAVAITAWLQISTPVHGEVPGNGQPIALLACRTLAAAELVVAQLVVSSAPIGGGCLLYRPPVYPTPQMLREATLVIGPLSDWEGDTFAVFEATNSTGMTVYPFVWWGPGYAPMGMEI